MPRYKNREGSHELANVPVNARKEREREGSSERVRKRTDNGRKQRKAKFTEKDKQERKRRRTEER